MKATEWLAERAFHNVAVKADEIHSKSKAFREVMDLISTSAEEWCGNYTLVEKAIDILKKARFSGKFELLELVNKYYVAVQEAELEKYGDYDRFHAEVSYGYRTLFVHGGADSCRMVINQLCDEMNKTPWDRFCYTLVNETKNKTVLSFAR